MIDATFNTGKTIYQSQYKDLEFEDTKGIIRIR
jgi:hypothetical protein